MAYKVACVVVYVVVVYVVVCVSMFVGVWELWVAYTVACVVVCVEGVYVMVCLSVCERVVNGVHGGECLCVCGGMCGCVRGCVRHVLLSGSTATYTVVCEVVYV